MTEAPRWAPDTPVIALPFGPTSASVEVWGAGCILMGWSVIETTGVAAAEVDFMDGQDDRGTELAAVALSAGQSTRDTLSSWGLDVQRGLRARMVTGTVRGVAWVIIPALTPGR